MSLCGGGGGGGGGGGAGGEEDLGSGSPVVRVTMRVEFSRFRVQGFGFRISRLWFWLTCQSWCCANFLGFRSRDPSTVRNHLQHVCVCVCVCACVRACVVRACVKDAYTQYIT